MLMQMVGRRQAFFRIFNHLKLNQAEIEAVYQGALVARRRTARNPQRRRLNMAEPAPGSRACARHPAPAPAPRLQPNGTAARSTPHDLAGRRQNTTDRSGDSWLTSSRGAIPHAEKLLGVPANEMIRMPKANAAEHRHQGVLAESRRAAEAKDYDFSGVKFADGTELDQGFADTMRAALLISRTPKERAPEVVKAIVKFMESADAAEAADVTAKVQAEAAALDKNWGTNKAANLVVAQAALDRLGQAAGLTAEQTKAAWDALSKVGGVGASYAMEMLRIAGARMGEDRFIGGGQGNGGTGIMSREAAKTEIDSLKKDADFGRRLLAGGREERRKWDDLHKVAFPPQVA